VATKRYVETTCVKMLAVSSIVCHMWSESEIRNRNTKKQWAVRLVRVRFRERQSGGDKRTRKGFVEQPCFKRG